MAQLTQAQVAELVFIPFPEGVDDEQFADFDAAHGMGAYVDVMGGIVVSTQNAEAYTELMQQAADFFE